MLHTVVGMAQINNSFSGQCYFPYSVGVLEAYARRHLSYPDRYDFLQPIFYRLPVDEAVNQLFSADVAAFSLYVWNANLSLTIARELKHRKPKTLIVVGGPHVPDKGDAFLRKNPFVDIAIHGEGEKPFTEFLERSMEPCAWDSIPSVSFLREGLFVQTSRLPRMKSLDDVPSPYLEGLFDSLMSSHSTMQWIVVWETNRGCPFKCTFCDWGSATANKVSKWSESRLFLEIDWFAARKIEYVFTADANFGILPRDIDLARYCAEIKARTGYPRALSVQATKNAQDRSFDVQKILSDAGLNKGVVVSMQSMDPNTLLAIKRDNISLEAFQVIQQRFSAAGVETMTDLILGLPDETYDSFVEGVSLLVGNGQHNRIQFNNLSILPNAEMGDPEYQRRFGMEVIESRIINIHGLRESVDASIEEMQQLVVATNSMPRDQWVKTRAFAWMSALLHFDKVLQIPLILTHELAHVPYRSLFELFSDLTDDSYPVISGIRRFFLEKARRIQEGDEEFCHSSEWLDIWWPADEYVLIDLVKGGTIDVFYDEAGRVLAGCLVFAGFSEHVALMNEAVRLNKFLLKRPFVDGDLVLEFPCDIWEFYSSVKRGFPVPLTANPVQYRIDRTNERWDSWDDWYRKVVWWGNKKGAYLYGTAPEIQLAGHY